MSTVPNWVVEATQDIINNLSDRRGLRQTFDRFSDEERLVFTSCTQDLIAHRLQPELTAEAIIDGLCCNYGSFNREWSQVDSEVREEVLATLAAKIKKHRAGTPANPAQVGSTNRSAFTQDTTAFYRLPLPEQKANLYAHARYPVIDAGLTPDQQAWELREAWLQGSKWQSTRTPLDSLGPKERLMYDLNAIVDMWDDAGVRRADAEAVVGSVLSLIDGDPYDDDLPSGPGYYLIPKDGPLNAEFDLSGGLAYLWDNIND